MFQWVNVKGWVMVIGTITAYAGIASFPWNIVIQVGSACCWARCPASAWALFGSALRPGPDLAAGGAHLQHRHGGAAAGLALSGLHGRMMPHRAMQKRVSPDAEKCSRQRRKFAGDRRS